MKYIIALDEGTTSTRAVLYNTQTNKIENVKSIQIKQFYPKSSYVEESATEIYSSTIAALIETIEKAGAENIAGIGITNQRETVVAWERSTGKPLYNAIIWQCRRTMDYCKELESAHGEMIRQKTGLKVDAYFSASKMRWLLDNVPACREALERGDLCLGTIESFLVFKLSKNKEFVTDYTNASRTMLFNIHTLDWDEDLLKLFNIPRECLAKVVSPDSVVGEYEYGGVGIKIAGLAGDQQSASVGQGCFVPGSVKVTYGTGMFMLMNVGDVAPESKKGLLTTLGYAYGKPVYMFEGSVFNAGSAIQWLRDGLGFFEYSWQSEKLAASVKDTGGVYVVPAFTGLGAPYWKPDATGIITGITRGTTKAHITRAALEAMAYSAKELADIMSEESGVELSGFRVDGGASQNNLLMQFQADVLNAKVQRPTERESTALGAVYLCMIALGIASCNEVEHLNKTEHTFVPQANREYFSGLYSGWLATVNKCIN